MRWRDARSGSAGSGAEEVFAVALPGAVLSDVFPWVNTKAFY